MGFRLCSACACSVQNFETCLHLRKAYFDWGLDNHYTTHHFGYWNNVAADLGKWTAWEEFEPDYEELLQKIAVRDYGKNAAVHVMNAWKFWSEAMNFYTASNEDQYGPWRVGAAYPFVFHPNISPPNLVFVERLTNF